MEATPANRSTCVLIVAADESLVQEMSLDLRRAGYEPVVVTDGPQALQQAQTLQPELIVIDRLLGEVSGLQICCQLRSLRHLVPVLLLMVCDRVQDRVDCLEAGADDYCLKPYQGEAFLERVNLYLKPDGRQTEQLRFGDLVLNLANRKGTRQGRTIDLTMKEFELLKYLMENPGEVLSRDQILEHVWGYDFMGESNVIEVYIRYLRLKIEQEGERRLIQTVRGAGYVLRET